MFLKGELMSIKTMLGVVATPKLLEYGFGYEGKSSGSVWSYSKKKGDVIQYIVFEQSGINPKAIRAGFKTSLKKLDVFYSDTFENSKWPSKTVSHYWKY